MDTRRRTLKGIRADLGMNQTDASKVLGMNLASYSAIEQFIDDPAKAEAISKLYGVKIEVTVTGR